MRDSFLIIKSVCVAAGLMLASALAYADTLDGDAIKHIHGQIVVSFTANCKKMITNNADAVCGCLAGKANDFLDDDALAQCANDDTGMDCVSKAVAAASTKALVQDNVTACTQLAAVQTPAAPTVASAPAAATTPSLPPAPNADDNANLNSAAATPSDANQAPAASDSASVAKSANIGDEDAAAKTNKSDKNAANTDSNIGNADDNTDTGDNTY